jgi:hypothetical protein
MALNFQRGDLVNVLYQASGQPQFVLNIQGHNLDLSSLLIDVTSSGSIGNRDRIPGVKDAAGSFKLSFDLDQPFYGPMTLINGTLALASFGVNAAQTRYIQVPVCVEKVGVATAREQDVQLSVDVKMANRAGFFIFPPIP